MQITGARGKEVVVEDITGGIAPGGNKGEGMSFDISVEMIIGM